MVFFVVILFAIHIIFAYIFRETKQYIIINCFTFYAPIHQSKAKNALFEIFSTNLLIKNYIKTEANVLMAQKL